MAVLFAFWIGGPFFFPIGKAVGQCLSRARICAMAIKARLFQHLMGHSRRISFMENLPGRIAQKLTQAATSGHSLIFMLTIELVQTDRSLTITACLLIGTLSARHTAWCSASGSSFS